MTILAQIAEKTGVSASTISRVLHGRGDVNRETRERIMDELRKARYALDNRPNRRGRPSRQEGTAKAIAIVCQSHLHVRRDPFKAPILTAVLENAQLLGAQAVAVDWPVGQDTPPESLERVDAAIMVSGEAAYYLPRLPAHTPLVILDGYLPGKHADGIVPDYRAGACEAVAALLAQGHTRICLSSAKRDLGNDFDAQVYDGARRAFDFAGTPVWEHLVGGYAITPEQGYALGKELLSLPKSSRPTAFFGSDNGIIGILRAAHDLNLRVPQDLALIGIDDIEMGRYCLPRLSTVRVDKEALARIAVERALWRCANPRANACRLVIDCEFIRRDSCGAGKA